MDDPNDIDFGQWTALHRAATNVRYGPACFVLMGNRIRYRGVLTPFGLLDRSGARRNGEIAS